ncbi:MAG: NAD(P)H-dependent oxidoreductase subunit E [Clostridia bacterium]|nr:NAD(P)H-dependent oxidoreductase subunit E [Clostridia bacterium]
MKITVCIGSSCHVKGSRGVVENLQRLIAENNVGDKVELGGTFCLGQCRDGVCVEMDNKIYSLTQDSTEDFFTREVMTRI